MRKTMLTSFALLALAIAPALADSSAVTTQSPPSPNSGQAGIQSDNSLPPTADTSERTLSGDQLGQSQARSSANMPVDQAMRDNTASHKVVRQPSLAVAGADTVSASLSLGMMQA